MTSMTVERQGRAADLQEHDEMTTPCKACGHRFGTRVRGNSVRCPACKASNYIPKARPAAAEIISVHAEDGTAPAGWDPAPTPVVELEDADTDCLDCETPLVWTPGGTLHYCEACETPVFPAVLLPAADEADPRRVPTRVERDLAAIALAQRKGVMLVQLGALADDDRIDPVSLPIIEWFRDEVKSAGTSWRLSELAELLPRAGIRRRRWWQARPALDPAGYLDEEEDDGEEFDEGQDDEDEPHTALVSARAITPAVDHAAALVIRGWRIDPDAPPGQCQIRSRTHYSGDPNYYLCGAAARKPFGGAATCTNHYDALTRPLP